MDHKSQASSSKKGEEAKKCLQLDRKVKEPRDQTDYKPHNLELQKGEEAKKCLRPDEEGQRTRASRDQKDNPSFKPPRKKN